MAVITVEFLPDTIYTSDQSYNQQPIALPDFRPYEPNRTTLNNDDLIFGVGSPWFNESSTPSVQSSAVEGYFIPMLETDFYGRIFFIPSSVSAGAISSYKEETFDVWNAYLNSEQVYEITRSSSTDGLTISGDIATAFGRLEVREYTAEFTATGDPSINTTVSFEFMAETAQILITGVRVTLLPIWPQTGSTEELTAKTWVFVANDGTEQRSRSRSRPGRKITQEILTTIDEWPRVQNLLIGQSGNRWAVIQAGEAILLENASFTTSDTQITVQTDYAEFYEGGLCVVWKSSDEYHLATISTLDSNGITLETAFQANISGNLLVAPVFVGRGNANPSPKADPAGNHTLQMAYEIYESDTTLEGQVEDTYYQTYAVMTRENEGKSVSSSYKQNQFLVESSLGIASWGQKWTVPKVSHAFQWTFFTAADLWWFRLFFYEHQGNVPFWVPSFEKSLTVASDVGGSTLTITVTDDNFRLNAYALNNHIRITYSDGTSDLREIDSVADGGSGTTVLTLDSATSNLSTEPAAGVKVEFLRLVRFQGKASIKHYGYKSVATFTVVEVKQ